MSNLCNSCEVNTICCIVSIKGTQRPYTLCLCCLQELINKSLTKEHFKNLIKNGHTTKEFYLHDDFYDEDGNMLQPNGEVIEI